MIRVRVSVGPKAHRMLTASLHIVTLQDLKIEL